MASIRVSWGAGSRRVSSTDSERTLVEGQKNVRATRRERNRSTVNRRVVVEIQIQKKSRQEKIHSNTRTVADALTRRPRKRTLYTTPRAPPRRNTEKIRVQSTTGLIFPSSPAQLRAQPTREPTYAAELRTMIRDVVARKCQEGEDEDDRRLRALLGGRIIGGGDKFARVKENARLYS
ncbi:hypothetical protein C8R44DRAFT_981680 [Mycena epipterygia]|nr:hypothetical protein C8R44DRAFT_981680 [Mycena epipterygia]